MESQKEVVTVREGADPQSGVGAVLSGDARASADLIPNTGEDVPIVQQVHAAPDVYRIRVPFMNISTTFTNCYVVVDGGEALVIDTGAPTEQGAAVLRSALEDLGVYGMRTRFFLTHFHMDHAGLIDKVVPEGADLCVSPVELAHARASRTAEFLEQARLSFVCEGVPFADASGYARCAVEPPLFSSDRVNLVPVGQGARIVVGGYSLQVVEVPGHTAGHLALFEPGSGLLFCGDHVLFVISPSIAMFADGRDGVQEYLDSLERVRALAPTALLHSHGPLRDDFENRIEWLGRHHRERLDEARGIVQATPGMTGYEVLRAIKWNVPYERWDDISFVQRWCITVEGIVYLNHLVGSGAIRREAGGDGMRRYFA